MNRYQSPVIMNEEEKQDYRWEQYNSYIRTYRTTPKERKLLRRWVASGHSVYENPGSRYICDQYPPLDYLDVYRQDQEIKAALEGKSPAEAELYLKEYMGYETVLPEETTYRQKKSAREHIHDLEHELFFLWEYLCSEGLWNEAKEYLEEHEQDEIPFGYEE